PGQEPRGVRYEQVRQSNHLPIQHLRPRNTSHVNDKLVVDNAIMDIFWDDSKPLVRTGPIQLHTHGGEIRWRNIALREVPGDEANRLLRGQDDAGFKSVFNGKDFEGWAGPIDNYEVKDGAILCKPGKGGVIYTQ